MSEVDPLSVHCPTCGNPPGEQQSTERPGVVLDAADALRLLVGGKTVELR